MELNDYFDENGVLKKEATFIFDKDGKIGYPCTINNGEGKKVSGRLIIVPEELKDLKRAKLIIEIMSLREELSYVLKQFLKDCSTEELVDLLDKDLTWLDEKLK